MLLEQAEYDVGSHREAIERLDRWLCRGPAVVRSGSETGAVAGRIARDGTPDYAYPEITGYYLTWLAFRQRVGEVQAIHRELAEAVTEWVARWAATSMPTRLHLRPHAPQDWRNRAVFLFDMAMLIRGLAQVAACGLADATRTTATLSRLVGEVAALRDERGRLRCMALRGDAVPDRWSTRPGPFLIKALAAILHADLPGADSGVNAAVRATLPGLWPRDAQAIHPDSDHAALYFVEGVLLAGERGIEQPTARMQCQQILRRRLVQLHGDIAGFGARHDVLAQWLRASLLLPAEVQVDGADRLHRAAAMRLAIAVAPDGALPFASDGTDTCANVWCAMFAHQALWLALRKGDGAPASLPEGCLI